MTSCSLLAFPLSVSLASWHLRCLYSSTCSRQFDQSKKKKNSHGNNVCDVIMAHVINGDTQTNRCKNVKQS